MIIAVNFTFEVVWSYKGIPGITLPLNRLRELCHVPIDDAHLRIKLGIQCLDLFRELLGGFQLGKHLFLKYFYHLKSGGPGLSRPLFFLCGIRGFLDFFKVTRKLFFQFCPLAGSGIKVPVDLHIRDNLISLHSNIGDFNRDLCVFGTIRSRVLQLSQDRKLIKGINRKKNQQPDTCAKTTRQLFSNAPIQFPSR